MLGEQAIEQRVGKGADGGSGVERQAGRDRTRDIAQVGEAQFESNSPGYEAMGTQAGGGLVTATAQQSADALAVGSIAREGAFGTDRLFRRPRIHLSAAFAPRGQKQGVRDRERVNYLEDAAFW